MLHQMNDRVANSMFFIVRAITPQNAAPPAIPSRYAFTASPPPCCVHFTPSSLKDRAVRNRSGAFRVRDYHPLWLPVPGKFHYWPIYPHRRRPVVFISTFEYLFYSYSLSFTTSSLVNLLPERMCPHCLHEMALINISSSHSGAPHFGHFIF